MNLNELITALQKLQSSHGHLTVLDSEGYSFSNVALHLTTSEEAVEWDANEGEEFVILNSFK